MFAIEIPIGSETQLGAPKQPLAFYTGMQRLEPELVLPEVRPAKEAEWDKA